MAVPTPPVRYRPLLGVMLVLAASLAGAQTPTPQGAEFQVNSYTSNTQRYPSVAGVGSAGDFVVAWHSYGNQDGNYYGVFGQRFDSAGIKQGAEFQVNSYTTNNQFTPSVAGVGSAGDFVVAWKSNTQDADGFGIFGQRFDSGGIKLGAEFQVNSFTAYNQRDPSVASVGSAGDFVVAWYSSHNRDGNLYGVFGQRFDSGGNKLGAEFQVNSYTTGFQGNPSVAGVSSAGDFVVAWFSGGNQDGDNYGVFGQRFGSDGTKQGAEFQVNSYTTSSQAHPAIAGVGSAGAFVVAWYSDLQDGDSHGVFGQRFASDGTKQGAEFQVNSYTTNIQTIASIAGVGSAGDFVVAWHSLVQDGHQHGIFGQRFSSGGIPQGAEFQVNSYTLNAQANSSVAGQGTAGDFVVAWQSNTQDGSNYGVFGQRFAGPVATGTVTVTAPGSTKDAWAVGSVQRLRAEHDMGSSATFDIAISRDAGSTFPEPIATGVASAANGTALNFDWTVSAGTAGTPQTAAVRVSRNGAPSISDDSTSVVISGPSINVDRPRNNVQTSPFKIVWLHNLGYRRPFKIELDRDAASVFQVDEVIAASTLSQWAWRGEFQWTPTGSCAVAKCVMRITSLDNSTFDDSVPFKIILP